MINTQELRRRWSDRTNAVFSPRDRFENREYAAETYEREFDFKGCRSIVFLDGNERTGHDGSDVLLLTQGSGHMTLPAGVRVLVQSGYARWQPAASVRGGGGSSSGASTVLGTGVRAPPPSFVSGYCAPSLAGSAYGGAAPPRSHASERGSNADGYYRFGPPTPGHAASSFSRGAPGPGSSYNMSACGVPLPPSDVGRAFGSSRAGAGDWEVVAQMDGAEERLRGDDVCSIVPEDSISSVGSHGYSRRFAHDY